MQSKQAITRPGGRCRGRSGCVTLERLAVGRREKGGPHVGASARTAFGEESTPANHRVKEMALTTTSVPQGAIELTPDKVNACIEFPVATYQRLAEVARGMFASAELNRLAPRTRHVGAPDDDAMADGKKLDPLAATEVIAYDFLSKGGKHSRPFITLAAYHALTLVPPPGGNGRSHGPDEKAISFSDAVKRTAMSIEIFHKASLVHDDIEDDDSYRYGDKTIHRRFGTPAAINVGDYLIGMGYRLLSGEACRLGAETVADILDRMADSHVKLTEGQGAELHWRDSLDKQLSTKDAIRIYELKTAPAFEAALYSGLRLAGKAKEYLSVVPRYARHLGVAFQILNDLGDWVGDDHNKLAAGGDVLGGRPTVLWALALEGLPDTQRETLVAAAGAAGNGNGSSLSRVRRLYEQAGVFARAAGLIERHRREAVDLARSVNPPPLKQLLLYLVEKVLARPESAAK
jgi:geranylgeranyl pyrophosphate synthase